MSPKSILERAAPACAALLLSILPPSVSAAPQPVLPFGTGTWAELGASPLRPLAVVFTTTDCTHCPAAIDGLAKAMRKAGSKTRLVVVVMDGAGQDDALRKDRHYAKAGILYAFAGDPAALRYTVNPAWRGLTPYVALLPRGGSPQFHNGAPPPDAVAAFLRP